MHHGIIFTDVYDYIVSAFPTKKIPIIFTLQQHCASQGVTVGWALAICLSYSTNRSNGLVLGKSVINLML